VTWQETTFTWTIRRSQRLQQIYWKNNMSIWLTRLSVKGASKLMLWFSPAFSGVLVNATALAYCCCLKVLLKKHFSHCDLANTARSLHFFSLETLRFLAADGITDFGIALDKHCNLVSCSFVLQIDWLKPLSVNHAITCGVNGLTSFICRALRNATIKIVRTVPNNLHFAWKIPKSVVV